MISWVEGTSTKGARLLKLEAAKIYLFVVQELRNMAKIFYLALFCLVLSTLGFVLSMTSLVLWWVWGIPELAVSMAVFGVFAFAIPASILFYINRESVWLAQSGLAELINKISVERFQ